MAARLCAMKALIRSGPIDTPLMQAVFQIQRRQRKSAAPGLNRASAES
jgi:hypothetical protein